jgi:N-acetylglucosamine-6-phosphate deacetylase
MGSLEKGKLANLVIVSENIEVRRVLLRGRVVEQGV